MRFSMGVFDRLFGEKVSIQLPGGQTRIVTKRWLEEIERQGKARDVTNEKVRVHLLRAVAAMMFDTLDGKPIPTYQLGIWTVGNEVSKGEVERYRDPKSGDLYAMVMSKLDRATMKVKSVPELCSREYWNKQAKMNGVAMQ